MSRTTSRNTPTRPLRQAIGLLGTGALLASIALGLAPRALGADVNPPPPGIPPIARRIPESVRAQFHLHVYPSYQSWLANSNGLLDCEQVFVAYLVTQGVVGPRSELFVLLYLELVPEEAA